MARQLNAGDHGTMPTLYISGHLGEEFGEEPLAENEDLLHKPFSVNGLVDRLESMLTEKAGRSALTEVSE